MGQTVVRAMEALNIYVDEPKDMTEEDVKQSFINLARQAHPDKIHRRPDEDDDQFNKRKSEANLDMQMLNHHYKVLKAYIEERDKNMWERLRAHGKHSVERYWQDHKAKR